MNLTAELWAFALVMAIGQFSPGPDMLLLTRTALAEGLRAGWLMVAGIVTGLAFHATLAIGGMAVLLASGGVLSFIVKILAAAYLIWLAWGLLKKAQTAGEDIVIPKRSPYLRGLFCNLLNPKVLVFFAGVVAPFLTPEHPQWWPVALWSIIVLEGLFLWCLWVWLLQISRVRRAYKKAGRVIDLAFALGLVALAMNLLFGAS
ncbi:LysE family translocator [Akkermansiaceae bacterium]|nr:LysE family translocator [Akkermansiaceae bacterium]MDB4272709.1 LysE family translocator [Akkermansiaceae bacterium]MDB4283178.1 LysE family translocator [Akkermansiaceae bacterium]MDB4451724.1 LysE family translocator [Akkermansiaceae bacterium]MDB4545637.1 LysE family translocator [Akkermansiaceae bacterium]